MKKVLLGALAVVAMVACSKDDVVEMNRVNDQISYSAVVNSATRAADVFCNNNKPTSFTVSAVYDSKPYFVDETVTYNAGAWESGSVHYWPNSGDVTFYAHVNGGDNFKYAGSKAFSVESVVANQVDLMYAVQKQAKSESAVTLNFRHALSQIVFEAKKTNNNIYVEVSGVEVHNVANASTFTYPTEATADKVGEHNGNGAIDYENQAWGEWATPTGSADYATSFTAVPVNSTTPVSLTNVADGANSNAMLLMPQPATTAWVPATHPKVAETDGTYLLINCCIYNVADTSLGFQPATDVALWGTQAAHEKIAVPVSFAWEQGKKYVYTLVFGNGNGGYDPTPEDPSKPEPVLVPISYTITVDDFVVVTPSTEVEVK